MFVTALCKLVLLSSTRAFDALWLIVCQNLCAFWIKGIILSFFIDYYLRQLLFNVFCVIYSNFCYTLSQSL